MNVVRAAGIVATCLPLGSGVADACGEGFGATRTVESANYTVAFRTVPEPIGVGAHFAIDFAVCPRAKAEAPRAVRVDATMPEHRHGMNYRPVVTAQPDDRSVRYRAEGLLFHMPGRWVLTFDVDGNGRTERITSALQIE